jgi:light-regulated signal transduction histidine kinase (bacteriophytochrome)
MHYKKIISVNENINLKIPSFLWQGNLPNRASNTKRSLARHGIHLPRASGQVLSYTSAEFVVLKIISKVMRYLGLSPPDIFGREAGVVIQ